ncbi:MAG TPA: HD domain-containing phosphohydrolase [Candidatus Eisenbacteria bacterium]|nr:HD domain-containing phosphohydrolase [Candidatus Eisenbacteria bacterium]
MKSLRIERLGSRDEFRFALQGEVDDAGARSLDRLLFECQARGAAKVELDFGGVSRLCTLATSVLVRQGKVYRETERCITVRGLRGEARAAVDEAGAVLFEVNGNDAPATAVACADAVTPAPSLPSSVVSASSAVDLPVLQTKLRRKIIEFRNLFEITRALNLALDLEEVLNLLGLSVMGQFGVERLAIFLSDADRGGVLVPRQVRGFAQGHFKDLRIPPEAVERGAGVETFFLVDARPGEASPLAELKRSGLEWGLALRVRSELIGVLLIGGRSGRSGFQEDERDLLTTLAHQGAVAIANARFHRVQEERNLGLVRGMMALLESRDPFARGGTERVVRYVTAMARVLHYPREQVKSLIYGAVLRDIGMITVSGLILKNPAHLSEEEWALIKQHPVRGAQILEEMTFPKEVLDVVRNHHERWGGEGYPAGIRGQEIPLGARIVSLVDAYVAMTMERPYRRALPYEKARQVIAENWGVPFDPELVLVFLSVLDKVESRSRLNRAGGAPPPNGTEEEAPPLKAELDPLASGAVIPTSHAAVNDDPEPSDPVSRETSS